MRERAWILVLPGLVATLTLLAAGDLPAEAAFPGTNGKIAFVSDRSGNDDVFTMTPGVPGTTNVTHALASDDDPA